MIDASGPGTTTRQKHYVGNYMVYTQSSGAINNNEYRFLLDDHLGSVDAITDVNGYVIERKGYDVFGQTRTGNWRNGWSGAFAVTDRGFTQHEHLTDVGLIRMNGRAYDPALGRFLSVDPFIQFPEHSQSLNGYSYVLNNPLSATDPTGYLAVGSLNMSQNGFSRRNESTASGSLMSGYLVVGGQCAATCIGTGGDEPEKKKKSRSHEERGVLVGNSSDIDEPMKAHRGVMSPDDKVSNLPNLDEASDAPQARKLWQDKEFRQTFGQAAAAVAAKIDQGSRGPDALSERDESDTFVMGTTIKRNPWYSRDSYDYGRGAEMSVHVADGGELWPGLSMGIGEARQIRSSDVVATVSVVPSGEFVMSRSLIEDTRAINARNGINFPIFMVQAGEIYVIERESGPYEVTYPKASD